MTRRNFKEESIKKLIIPSGQDVIKPNDRVIVVTKEKNYDDIDDIVYYIG